MSSISAIGGKPPASLNTSRFTKIAWSPVAMPVSRERRFISRPTSAQRETRAVDLDVEAAPGAVRVFEIVEQHVIGVGGQARVAMQEQQHIAFRLLGAGIHLRGAPARRRNDTGRPQPRALDGRVAAAAVDHDDLDAERAQRRERVERAGDALALVEHRDDDGEIDMNGPRPTCPAVYQRTQPARQAFEPAADAPVKADGSQRKRRG